MFVSILIHALEAITGLLVCYLFFQVRRCYRVAGQVSDATSPLSSSETNEPMLATSAAEQVTSNNLKAITAETDSAAPSGAETLLTDYIGAFFSETQVADIQVYKASKTEENNEAITLNEEPLTVPAEFRSTPEIKAPAAKPELVTTAATAEAVTKGEGNEIAGVAINVPVLTEPCQEPILLNQVHVDDPEDDTFILVESEDKGSKGAVTNVMSDKVVHAMLDEAKLVCAS